MTDPLIEAAAQALQEFREAFIIAVGDKSPFAKQALLRADTAIAAIPMIEAAALERAAKVAEEFTTDYRCINGHDRCDGMGDASCPYCERFSESADAIRAMKQPAESSAA